MDLQAAFAPDGPLAHSIEGYVPREQQLEMATQVAQACESKSAALLEAGTGTGKTFAYLVPLLQLGIRTVVSTSTRGLQDQLFARDLPALKQALGATSVVRLLKGRANYICKLRLRNARQQGKLDMGDSGNEARMRRDLDKIAACEEESPDGDIAGVRGVPRFSPVWRMATSTSDNCLRRECEFFDGCHLYRARSEAMEGDVIVVNHSVVFSDMALRAEGGGKLLPDFEAVVFDEAHELPDMLIEYLADSLDTRTVIEEASEIAQSEQFEGRPDLRGAAEEVAQAGAGLVKAIPAEWPPALTMATARDSAHFMQELRELHDRLNDLAEAAEALAEDEDAAGASIAQLALQRAKLLHQAADTAAAGMAWIEISKTGLRVRCAPDNADELFAQQVIAGRAAIFTSASMSVDGSFDGISARLGISDARQGRWESPFDFERNSRLLLQPQLPDPSRERDKFDEAVAEVALQLCRASRGRAFVLLSSRRAMKLAGDTLHDELGGAYDVLVQGQNAPHILLEKFRDEGGRPKVLVGTRTFWQGVDIRGEALSLVVIDRIPFTSPQDPILKLLAEKLPDGPDSKFEMLQLPAAATLLKQAAGRLLRSEHDRGVLAICDPRLLMKSYGLRILDSLPPMPRTERIDDAAGFLRELAP